MTHKAFIVPVVSIALAMGAGLASPVQASGPPDAQALSTATGSLPGPPGNLTAVGSNALLHVNWTAAAGRGHPITGYQPMVRHFHTTTDSWSPWAGASLPADRLSRTFAAENGQLWQARVRASNAVGWSTWATSSATMVGLPGGPATTTMTAGDHALTVTWGATAGNGSTVSTYRVAWRSSVDGAWTSKTYRDVAAPTHSTTFSGLVEGRRYQAYVTALNRWGWGPAGPVATAVAGGPSAFAPGAPTAATATAGINAVTASWTTPVDTGTSPLTGFTATSHPGDATCETTAATECTITGLIQGASYMVTVTASNEVGTSPASAASNAVETEGITQVSAGSKHTCALITTGAVECWGYGLEGELGNGDEANSPLPVQVSGLSSGVTQISVGDYHSCALLDTGGVECWGFGQSGELGNADTSNSSVPVQVEGLDDGVQQISAGGMHTCALLVDDSVWCWGFGDFGQLGDGQNSSSSTPVEVEDLTGDVQGLTAGLFTTCALLTSSEVDCWGYNEDGEFGNGTTTSSPVPVLVTDWTDHVADFSSGVLHSCAVMSSGAVACSGYNDVGQLGDGTYNRSLVPIQPTGMTTGATAVVAGAYHTCALMTPGSVRCWGQNDVGQLGNGTTSWSTTSVPVTGLTTATNLTLGEYHTCARTPSGALCWGQNSDQQLGDGTTNPSDVPIAVHLWSAPDA